MVEVTVLMAMQLVAQLSEGRVLGRAEAVLLDRSILDPSWTAASAAF